MPFIGLGILPLVFAVFAELTLSGAVRWLVVGAAIISGPWLVALTVLLFSGAAPQMMGVQAEEWTAQELRAMRRKGWHAVSGLKPKSNFDIDQIAIGPAGLFVVEVKWSGDSWPTEKFGSSYSRQQLSRSIGQVKRNLRDVEQILGETADGIPASAVCVLWSGDASWNEAKITEMDGVTVVPGPLFRGWLRSKDVTLGSKEQVDQVWRKLTDFIDKAETSSIHEGVVYRPTLSRLVIEWTLLVVSGFIVALSTPIAVFKLTGSWVADFVGIVIEMVAGLVARRAKRWRQFGTGLICGVAVSVVTLLIAVLRAKA
ncbi:MAG: nuclease-related domain-containing protein [Acidimicrobiales bacterium]